MDGGPASTVVPGDCSKAVALSPISDDSFAIEVECRTAYVPAFEPGTTHPCTHSFDDQVSFEFGDGSDDHDESAAQRTFGVDALTEADEFDLETIHFVEDLDQVTGGPRDSVA